MKNPTIGGVLFPGHRNCDIHAGLKIQRLQLLDNSILGIIIMLKNIVYVCSVLFSFASPI